MKRIKTLPYTSQLNGLEFEEVVCLWKSNKNICELQKNKLQDSGNCDNSGYYYGTDNELEPKFCARHFYQEVVSGDGKTNYKLSN